MMLAKKKSKPRKSSMAKAPQAAKPLAEPIVTENKIVSDGEPKAPLNQRLQTVLSNAGLEPTEEQMRAAAGAGGNPDPLSRIPKKGQELLERFFGGGAIIFGSTFLLVGISISVEALCKVLNKPLPVQLDEIIVQYVEPMLTPSILILFGFSISLGLLKQLQLGSGTAGVLYTEEDE